MHLLQASPLDVEVPDGVDPAFLAALPEDIRAEVIRDHIRQQRVQRATQRAVPQPPSTGETPAAAAAPVDGAAVQEGASAAELDQEFLAALPPELQEEVLAQHEQRIAQQNREQAAPVNDVDPAALFDSLPPSLRAQVLADADDSVLQILPPNLVAEATRLRANMEQQVRSLTFAERTQSDLFSTHSDWLECLTDHCTSDGPTNPLRDKTLMRTPLG